MSEIGDRIQEKCMLFADRVIKLNDYLLQRASEVKIDNKEKPFTSYFKQQKSKVPVYLMSVATLSNQLLRAGTSIGANNAEATSAISRADYKSKSYIALKEARECLYWILLLHRNKYLNDTEFQSLYNDCEELVKILTHRCKKLSETQTKKNPNPTTT